MADRKSSSSRSSSSSSKSRSSSRSSSPSRTAAEREQDKLREASAVEPTKAAQKEAEEVREQQIDVHHDNVTNVPSPQANAVILKPLKGDKPVVLSFEDTGPQSTLVAVDGKPVGLIDGPEGYAQFARKARRVF